MVYRSNRRKTQRKKVSRKHKRISSKKNIRGGMMHQAVGNLFNIGSKYNHLESLLDSLIQEQHKKLDKGESDVGTFNKIKDYEYQKTQINDWRAGKRSPLKPEAIDLMIQKYKKDQLDALKEPETPPPPSVPPPPAHLPMAMAVPSSSRLSPSPSAYQPRYQLHGQASTAPLLPDPRDDTNTGGGRLTNKIKRINKYKNKKSNKSYKPLRVSKPKRTNRRKLKSKKR